MPPPDVLETSSSLWSSPHPLPQCTGVLFEYHQILSHVELTGTGFLNAF